MNKSEKQNAEQAIPADYGTGIEKDRKRKKTTITLALDDYVLDQIKRDAEESNQSLNLRINTILTKYVKFYRITESSGSAVIHPSLVQFMIREIDESKFIEEWKNMGVRILESAFVRKGMPITLDNFINIYLELASYAGVFKKVTKHMDDKDGKTCLFLSHGYDLKWSRIIGAAYSFMLENLLYVHTKLEFYPDGVEIKIIERIAD